MKNSRGKTVKAPTSRKSSEEKAIKAHAKNHPTNTKVSKEVKIKTKAILDNMDKVNSDYESKHKKRPFKIHDDLDIEKEPTPISKLLKPKTASPNAPEYIITKDRKRINLSHLAGTYTIDEAKEVAIQLKMLIEVFEDAELNGMYNNNATKTGRLSSNKENKSNVPQEIRGNILKGYDLDTMRALNKETKYRVLSPDGFDLEMNKVYIGVDEAVNAVTEFVEKFRKQGYYASNKGRISLVNVPKYCSIVPAEDNTETIERHKQNLKVLKQNKGNQL